MMERVVRTAVLGVMIVLPGLVYAQPNCREGGAANGECINSALIEVMQQNAVIFSQPKISITAFPILPADDYRLRYPNQLIPPQAPPAGYGTTP
jgi:hypothetical protein